MRIEVQVIPRARQEAVVVVSPSRLKVKVTAAPVDGAANTAVIRLLCDYFGVRRSTIALVRGETSRLKIFDIDSKDLA